MVQYSNTIIDIIQKHRRERKQRTPGWEEMLTQVLQFYGLLWELKCAMPLWTWKYPVSCFPLSHTHRGTDWCMLTGQVKIRTQIHTLLKKKVRKKRQKKRLFNLKISKLKHMPLSKHNLSYWSRQIKSPCFSLCWRQNKNKEKEAT